MLPRKRQMLAMRITSYTRQSCGLPGQLPPVVFRRIAELCRGDRDVKYLVTALQMQTNQCI